ncbi:N-acetylmuramoyl-L-alanine amidase [Micromonospora sp. NPDC052213]|uniref:peptidoglycan recognition protein family protein n=1 Tax=Micromonospora sp. NPDC052213 TaxID=3155812 RepID=UPI003433EC9B
MGRPPPESRSTVPWSKQTVFMGHYSAASATQTPRQIQDYHMRVKSWSDIGYNFLINSISGVIYEGRGWTTLGAHCSGRNTEAIGVCIIGKDQPGRQDVSARRAFKWLYEQANDRKGKRLQLLGHRDRGNTSCPGDEIYAWLHAGLSVGGGSTPAPAKPPASPRPARRSPSPCPPAGTSARRPAPTTASPASTTATSRAAPTGRGCASGPPSSAAAAGRSVGASGGSAAPATTASTARSTRPSPKRSSATSGCASTD